MGSKLQRSISLSDYDHVALILKRFSNNEIVLMESNSNMVFIINFKN